MGISRVVIAGLGLMGGSVAMAVRRSLPGVAIAAWDDEAVLEEALNRGVIDATSRADDLQPGDLLVLAAPPIGSLYVLDSLRALPEGVIITDVVSTKRVIVEAAASKSLPFVGGHPMTGSERAGLAYASASLFDGRRWFLVDIGAGDAVNDAVEAFVRSIGAVPEWIEPVEHDRLMAALSHLPQVAASALMSVSGRLAGRSNLDLAGAGLRDTTRLAGSDAEMWAQIAASNAGELSKAVRLLREELEGVARALEAAEPLNDFFARGREWRSKLL